MFRRIALGLIVLLVLACHSGCGRGGAKGLRIAVVPKGTTQEFWLTVKAGADQAGREAGARIIWNGPAKETDVAGQVAIIEDLTTQKVDAIVMAACDADGLIAPVRNAIDAGIPVVTIDSGIASDDAASFVATDNIDGARKAADALAKLIGGRGKVALIPFVKGAATSNMREQGFKDGIGGYPGMKLVAVQYSQSDVDTGMKVTEDILTAHPDLAGIFAANEAGAVGCARALEQRGAAGKVKLVAFDAAPAEIDALRRGTIQALVVQNPFQMGYRGVKAALDVIAGREVENRIDTGVTVATKGNMREPDVHGVLFPLEK